MHANVGLVKRLSIQTGSEALTHNLACAGGFAADIAYMFQQDE